MFDLGSWGEFIIILVVALVLIGPKDMPALVKTFAKFVYKIRKSINHFRSGFDDIMHEVEREDIIASSKDKKDKIDDRKS